MSSISSIKNKSVLALAAVIVAGAVVAVFLLRDRKEETDTLRVPLGVEQAAIVTYSGPTISVAPYKWGVAVNVRLAEVIEQPGRRVYDVRYIVNREGSFDLKDYLMAEDGRALEGLPSFKFTGDPKLSKNLDQRIQETEEIRVDVGGRYYETMVFLTVLWIIWLLLLIFYKRPRAAVAPEPEPTGPTLAEMLREFLARLEDGTLDAGAKAKMEMLLLQRWRDELAPGSASMADAIDRINGDKAASVRLRKLQHWLHHRASSVPGAEIAALLTPYIGDAGPARAEAATAT